MKYDYKDEDSEIKGFYEWNKDHHLIKKDDERHEKFKAFKKENGFYPDECWNLFMSVCIFLLPRLKYFRNTTIGHPCCISSLEEWKEILDKMIFAFEEGLKDDWEIPKKYRKKRKKNMTIDEEHEQDQKERDAYNKDIQEGLDLFSKYFWNLWW